MSKVPVFIEDGELNITSEFGPRIDPVTNEISMHKGIDITRWTGYSNLATICAYADGTVIEVVDGISGVDYVNQRGNYVTIDHGNGWTTKYYHLANGTVEVKVGDKITARTPLGYMGNTGYSAGAHLHFQMELDGIPQDPHPYITGKKTLDTKDEAELDNIPAEWAEEAVEWAKANDIIKGDEKGDLMLRKECTREEMLVFLYRARNSQLKNSTKVIHLLSQIIDLLKEEEKDGIE